MTAKEWFGIAFSCVGMLGMFAWAAHEGYLRRREYWDRRSWVAMAILTSAVLVPIAAMLIMSGDLDTYRPAKGDWRTLWVLGQLALMVGGVIATMTLGYWFARGDPRSQPRWFRRAKPGELTGPSYHELSAQQIAAYSERDD